MSESQFDLAEKSLQQSLTDEVTKKQQQSNRDRTNKQEQIHGGKTTGGIASSLLSLLFYIMFFGLAGYAAVTAFGIEKCKEFVQIAVYNKLFYFVVSVMMYIYCISGQSYNRIRSPPLIAADRNGHLLLIYPSIGNQLVLESYFVAFIHGCLAVLLIALGYEPVQEKLIELYMWWFQWQPPAELNKKKQLIHSKFMVLANDQRLPDTKRRWTEAQAASLNAQLKLELKQVNEACAKAFREQSPVAAVHRFNSYNIIMLVLFILFFTLNILYTIKSPSYRFGFVL
jgi:hypothetical protein